MSERSPTPWEVSDAAFWRIYDANGAEVVNAEGVVSEELSDRIVRAVNLHGEMVEALREMDRLLTQDWGDPTDKLTQQRFGPDPCSAWSKIRSALAKATTTEG